MEDLKIHPRSLISEIAERLSGVELGELRKTIYKMVGNELVTTDGRTYRRYDIKDGRKEIKKKIKKETRKLLIIKCFFFLYKKR